MKKQTKLCRLIIVLVTGFWITPALSDVSNDRHYSLGDDSGEGAIAGQSVGYTTTGGKEVTFDSEFVGIPSNAYFDAQDLEAKDAVNGGSPMYVNMTISGRPGATTNSLGVQFDGVNDRLEGLAFNRPDWYWDQDSFWDEFNSSEYPQNYEGLTNRGMQVWVKPDSTQQNVRQDIVLDSSEFGGVVITENNKWSLAYDMDDAERVLGNGGIFEGTGDAADVAFDQWSHAMVRTLSGTSNAVLYVNGVAVAAARTDTNVFGYDVASKVDYTDAGSALKPFPEPLFIGASDLEGSGFLEGDGVYENHFKGQIDELELFLWGDNTSQIGDNGQLGKDWGTFDFMTDNEYVAQVYATRSLADLNGDGSLNSDDINIFIANWLLPSGKEFGGLLVGDIDSLAKGDLDLNGIVDIFDAVQFNQLMVAAGAPPLDFASLQVPEPTTLTMLGIAGGWLVRRRRATQQSQRCSTLHHRVFAMIALLVTLTLSGTASAIQIELEIRQGSPIGPAGVISYDGYADVRMNGNFPTVSSGAENNFVGDAGNGAVNRSLVRWDLSALAGATVVGDATLSMRVIQVLVSDPNVDAVDINDYFDLHRIHDTNAGWVENNQANIVSAVLQPGDPSWNNFTEDPLRPWYDSNGTGDFPGLGNPGDGYATNPAATLNQESYTVGEDVQFTMSQAAVQDIIDGGANHPGFIFRSRDEGANPGRLTFSSIKSLHSMTVTVDITPTVLDLEINRSTSAISLNNNTGQAVDILGYQMISAGEALDSDAWQSIAGRLDAAGDETIDGDGEWEVLTAPGSRNNLSEFELDGDGGTIAAGISIDLGSAWIQNPNEDVQMLVALGDGSVVGAWIRYTGNQIIVGDLDFDGDLDIDDWLTLKPKFYADLTGKGLAKLYQAGDFNGDGITDETDFGIFKQLYDDANGSGAFEVMVASVPEPASLMLLGLAAVCLPRKRRGYMMKKYFGIVVLGICLAGSGSLEASVTIINDEFDDGAVGTNSLGVGTGFLEVNNNGAGTVTEAGGAVTIEAMAKAWNTTGIVSKDSFDVTGADPITIT